MTHRYLFISVLFMTWLCNIHALNIIALFPYQGRSHFSQFSIYLKELSKRGHNVTVVSYFPEENPPDNYHDIPLSKKTVETVPEDFPVQKSYFKIFDDGIFLSDSGIENCKILVENKEVQRMIKDEFKFDVAVTEQFNSDCSLGIAYKLKVPVVGMTSHVLMPYHYERLGIPFNPAYVPFHYTESGTKPSLIEKIVIAFFDAYCKAIHYYRTQPADQNTLAKYYDDIPPLEDLARNIKILLVYQHFVLTGSRIFPSNVIEIGGYHVPKAKPLTGDLKKFMDDAEHGVIYISFGSTIKGSSLPHGKVSAILEAMEEFPQRFIWKWEDKSLTVNKSKLFTSSWLPQADILGHPKTRAFFSHSGMGGVTEGIHHGVPILAMPIEGDQPANAAAVEESGAGVILDYKDLNKDNLVSNLKKILDPTFQEKVKYISSAWHDRPLSPLDTAVFWTEFAARNANITLRTAAADVSFYQYLNLDLVALLLALLASTFFIFKFMFSLCCGKKDAKKPVKRVKESNFFMLCVSF